MLLNYTIFLRLYDESKEYDDIDMFVAERGWQEWMDGMDTDTIYYILESIHYMAHSPFKDVREKYGYTRPQISRLYKIPYRTIQDWELDKRKAPEYIETLIYYSILIERMNEKGEKNVTTE